MIDLKQYPTRSKMQRFWLRMKKQIFIPERHLVPVKRNGFHDRLLEPGYQTFWRANEELGEPVNLGVRFADIKDHPVQTTDGIQIRMDVYTRYRFDPRQCTPDAISWMVALTPYKMRKMMKTRLGEAVQAVCGQYAAMELVDGGQWTRYDREIRQYLIRKLAHLGIIVTMQDAVTIADIQTPPRFAEIIQDEIAARTLSQLTESQARTLIKREFARRSESVHASYYEVDSYPPNVVLDMPYVDTTLQRRRNGRTHA
jgi:regulator of protease activity HflC (stomatin/prohibitin superfamily)